MVVQFSSLKLKSFGSIYVKYYLVFTHISSHKYGLISESFSLWISKRCQVTLLNRRCSGEWFDNIFKVFWGCFSKTVFDIVFDEKRNKKTIKNNLKNHLCTMCVKRRSFLVSNNLDQIDFKSPCYSVDAVISTRTNLRILFD